MRQTVSAIVIVALLAVFSGGAGHLHEHEAAHDAEHCVIHATLASPALAAGIVPVLMVLGLIAAFLTELPRTVHARRLPLHLDCRGPPAGF